MKFLSMIMALSLALASTSAFAFRCPSEMKKIDDALAKNPSLTAAQMAEVKKLRAEGGALHPSKHLEAQDALDKAKVILGIK